MSATKRRIPREVLAAVAVTVGLALLVGVPAYVATRAGFFGRYEGLEQQYEPWSESSHAEVSCGDCHVEPGALSRSAFALRMSGEFYVSLVNRSRVPEVFGTPPNDACLSCHNDLRSVSPVGDLQIPHRAHVQVLGMECVTCHSYLVHELNPKGEHRPTMTGCLECHDGDRAKDSCWACHTEKAAPSSHTAGDWLVVHADEASDEACGSCHDWSGDYCVQCHEQRPQSHGADWRSVHGAQVAEHRNCEACHQADFCIRCHGIVPQLNFDPTLGLVE